MDISERIDKEKEVLKKHGAENVEGYSLINNYGYRYTIDGKKYDSRFWANCYGCALNTWSDGLKEIDDDLNEVYREYLNW